MPYKDKDEQREAVRFAVARYRLKKKQEAEALGKKVEEEIPLEPENLNYGMEPTREKFMSWEEWQVEHPEDKDKKLWIEYKIKWSYENRWKAEQERENKRKAMDERHHFQTSNHDCILWRRQYSKKQRSDFFYNHISNCLSCSAWMVKNKPDSLDLNAVEDKQHFAELDGYAEVFSPPKPDPEDNIYFGGGVFPMNRMCPLHLCNLDENGECPMCKKGCD